MICTSFLRITGGCRGKLIKKGLIISPEYGHLEFAFPRFKEFVLCTYNMRILDMIKD